MGKDFKHIDQMYKKAFAEYKPESQTEHWNVISKQANRMRFYRFKPNTFNIYYVVLVIAILGVTGYILFDKFTVNTNDFAEKNIIIENNEETIIDTTLVIKLPAIADTLQIEPITEVSKEPISKTALNANNSYINITKPKIEKTENELLLHEEGNDTLIVDNTVQSDTLILPANSNDTLASVDTERRVMKVEHKTVLIHDDVHYKKGKNKKRRKKN